MSTSQMQMTIWTRAAIGAQSLADRFLSALARLLPDAFPARWGECDPLSIRGTSTHYEDVTLLWMRLANERGGVIGHSRTIWLSVKFLLGPARCPHEVWYRFPVKTISS